MKLRAAKAGCHLSCSNDSITGCGENDHGEHALEPFDGKPWFPGPPNEVAGQKEESCDTLGDWGYGSGLAIFQSGGAAKQIKDARFDNRSALDFFELELAGPDGHWSPDHLIQQ